MLCRNKSLIGRFVVCSGEKDTLEPWGISVFVLGPTLDGSIINNADLFRFDLDKKYSHSNTNFIAIHNNTAVEVEMMCGDDLAEMSCDETKFALGPARR